MSVAVLVVIYSRELHRLHLENRKIIIFKVVFRNNLIAKIWDFQPWVALQDVINAISVDGEDSPIILQ